MITLLGITLIGHLIEHRAAVADWGTASYEFSRALVTEQTFYMTFRMPLASYEQVMIGI